MNRGGQEAWTLIARTMRSSSFARICIEGDIDMARLEAMRRAGPDGENRRVSGHDVVCGAGRHISVWRGRTSCFRCRQWCLLSHYCVQSGAIARQSAKSQAEWRGDRAPPTGHVDIADDGMSLPPGCVEITTRVRQTKSPPGVSLRAFVVAGAGFALNLRTGIGRPRGTTKKRDFEDLRELGAPRPLTQNREDGMLAAEAINSALSRLVDSNPFRATA